MYLLHPLAPYIVNIEKSPYSHICIALTLPPYLAVLPIRIMIAAI